MPEETHRELRIRAAAAGLSLSKYLLGELTRIASRPEVAETLHRASERPISLADADIVASVRAGRDRA